MATKKYRDSVRATYRGAYLGMFPSAKQAEAAIERARKADRKAEEAWEAKMRKQYGINPKKRKRSAKHRVNNPRPVGLFRTKAAARKYAKEHARPGVKFSVRKIKRGK